MSSEENWKEKFQNVLEDVKKQKSVWGNNPSRELFKYTTDRGNLQFGHTDLGKRLYGEFDTPHGLILRWILNRSIGEDCETCIFKDPKQCEVRKNDEQLTKLIELYWDMNYENQTPV